MNDIDLFIKENGLTIVDPKISTTYSVTQVMLPTIDIEILVPVDKKFIETNMYKLNKEFNLTNCLKVKYRYLKSDNASTMIDVARTERSVGKVNPKFQQFAHNFGFNIISCVRARLNTKAKVENPMRVIDKIMSCNGLLDNKEQLYEKMQQITNEANSRIIKEINLL